MSEVKPIAFWNVPVSPSLNESLVDALEPAGYRTKTEFIRDAVRRRLEELGFRVPQSPDKVTDADLEKEGLSND